MLQLRGETQQRGFITISAKEMDAYWQLAVILMQRHAHGRNAGNVWKKCDWDESHNLIDVNLRVFRRQHPVLNERLTECRCEKHRVVAHETHQLV